MAVSPRVSQVGVDARAVLRAACPRTQRSCPRTDRGATIGGRPRRGRTADNTGNGGDHMADDTYDAIVIGTSQGGRFLPVDLARAGQRVALVERGPLGGVCVNTGCTPTKTMVASARLAYQARRGAEYGVSIGPVSVDLAAVRERKRAMVAGARENYASRLSQDGLELIEGEAHFTGPKTIEVALTDGGTRQLPPPGTGICGGPRTRAT